MKMFPKKLLLACTVCACLLLIFSFALKGPSADLVEMHPTWNQSFSIGELHANNQSQGIFMSSVLFNHELQFDEEKAFYGKAINIKDNPRVDRLLIGITNNLISRIEVWNQGKCIEIKELGFVGKMTWGGVQKMDIELYDENYGGYKGQSQIAMRFYEDNGFFGDIGTIRMNLSKYGNFDGEKSVRVFAKSLNDFSIKKPNFSNLKIWANKGFAD